MSNSGYSEVREVLRSPYADLPDEHLETVLEAAGVSAEGLDDLLESSRRARRRADAGLRRARPQLQGVAAGALQGARAGKVLGPWGALGGAIFGGARGLTRRPAGAPGVPASAPPPGEPSAAGEPVAVSAQADLPVPAAGEPVAVTPQAGLPVPAAGDLLSIMQQPQVQQALTAMMLGPIGTPTVLVGDTDVPVAAIPNMVGALAERAAAEYELAISSEPVAEASPARKLIESEDPQERADGLLTLFREDADLAPAEASWNDAPVHFREDAEPFEDFDEGWVVEAYEPVYGEAYE